MFARLTLLSVAALSLAACATSQNNPNYQYSTKYKVASPTQYAQTPPSTTTTQYHQASHTQSPAPVIYSNSTAQTASYTKVDHNCLNKETNRELIGAGIGGVAGAVAGNKLIGGTEGTVIGAVAGGAIGYGIGDKSINCDPVSVPITQTQAVVTPAYAAMAPEPYRYATVATPSADTAVTAEAPIDLTLGGPEITEAPTDVAYGETFGTPGYHAVLEAEAGISVDPDSEEAVIPVRPKMYVSNSESVPTDAYSTLSLGPGQHEIIEGDTVYSLARQLCVGISDIQSLNNLDGTYTIKLGDTLTLPPSRC